MLAHAACADSHIMEVDAAVIATATLGIMLLCLAWAGRRVLDRRRLAAWEAGAAASVAGGGPHDLAAAADRVRSAAPQPQVVGWFFHPAR
jgi:hypothetical protein